MAEENQDITVRPRGPYLVRGGVPLVRKSQIMSEHGEPLTWKKEETLDAGETYRLCRCGQSKTKPFCDRSHTMIGFEGDEDADTSLIADRAKTFTGQKLIVKDDHSLCVHSGFCGNRITNLWKMLKDEDDSLTRMQIMSMIEKCPSGTLAYALESDGEIVEPDLPSEITVIPDGPLWVSGGIPVERRDGQRVESRNRITLCRCGESKNRPFCDGTHKDVGFTDQEESS